MTEVRALEVELARRLSGGDATALALFLEIFCDRILAYCQLHCGHRQDAGEVAQETILKVCERAGELIDATQVRPWVFGIAREVCATYGRSAQPDAHELSLEHLPAHWLQEMQDRHALPDDEAYQHELRKLLGKTISALPKEFRTVVYLRDWEGLAWREIASVLSIPEEQARMLLVQGHVLMRQSLDAHFHAVQRARTLA
jgi:RNA polymerase sigma-70 factor (ECF subfamily)